MVRDGGRKVKDSGFSGLRKSEGRDDVPGGRGLGEMLCVCVCMQT